MFLKGKKMDKSNQALQTKYPHLEVSVLKLSEVKKDNESFRIDSEYFKKEYLELDVLLISSEYFCLKPKEIVSGPFGSTIKSESYSDSGICFIRVQDIKGGFFIEKDNLIKISESDNAKILNSQLDSGDLVVSKVGNSIGYVAQVQDDIGICNISENNIGIKLKSYDSCQKVFILTFLNSKFGQSQIWRRISGNAQPKINVSDFTKIKIPIFPMPFQLEIENLVKDSHKALESSKALYKEAEALLYEALGLDSKNPLQSILESKITDYHDLQGKSCDDNALNPNYTIATLKESFIKTGRLDAEYYKSKYDDIERFIKNYGYVTLQDLEIQDKNYTPKQEKQYHYIELANIGSNGNISTPTQDFGKNLPTRARRIVKEGDVIISSIEGSLSSCALITKEFDSCLVSTGFYVLRSKHINGETLLVLFKSEFFQDYLKKFPSGTILSAISKEELQNILIPKIDSTIQAQIAAHIQKSFELRAEAKSLLESAKAKVESALNNANNGGGGKTLLEQIKAKLKESKRFYRLAQWLLIETLCFNDVDFTPCDKANILDLQVWSSATHLRHEFDKSNSHNDKIASPNYTIRTLANSLKESGRLDAEYYQSKYEKNEALLKNYKYGFCKLKDLIQRQSSGFAFSSDEYVDCSDLVLIRINNIKNATLDMSNAVYLKNEAQNLSPKDKVYKGDILISMSGSIGMSCVVRDDVNAMLNQRIYKIAIRGFSPDVLVVFLNSVCAKLQFDRIGTGGVQTNISSSDIQNLLIPLLDSKTQEKIEYKISQSFELRAEAKKLLESAKQRVEEAIVSKKI